LGEQGFIASNAWNGLKDGFFVAVVVHIDKAVRKPTIGLQGMAIDVAAWVVDGALQYVGG